MSSTSEDRQQDDRIVVLDFGGQYTHLITRRLRDIGAYAELIPADKIQQKDLNCAGLILSGGPRSVGKVDAIEIPDFLQQFIISENRSVPILGICYGHQLLGYLTGGNIAHSDNREYGGHLITALSKSSLIPIADSFLTWMSHGDHVESVGDGFTVTYQSDNCPVAAMENVDMQLYGIQFHPEVTHTKHGYEILQNFVSSICHIATKEWDIQRYADDLIVQLREEIGNKQVILGVSGGVDSTVAAILLQQAIGDRLHAVFVDHGLLRKNEVEEVVRYFEDDLDIEHFHLIDASQQFLINLSGINDPERKREIIGHTFIEVFEAKALQLTEEYGKIELLGQGTIYSDRIESGAVGAESEKIKSHHNLTLPEKMGLEVIEPLKDLYKDEVRKLGRILGVPEEILSRYPFPGPGLAVRIIGEITKERLDILREADDIFTSMIYEENLDHLAWQAFAALLPIKATGVQGDNRAYGYIIALRSITSAEGMTADFSKFSWDFLGRVSTKIINSLPEVTRVVYDISTKPPGTIEFE